MKSSSFHLQSNETEVTLPAQKVTCNLITRQADSDTYAISCMKAYHVIVYCKMRSSPPAGKVCQRHSPLVRLRFAAIDFASCDVRQGSNCVLCALTTFSHLG